jgi:hypothetical protein
MSRGLCTNEWSTGSPVGLEADRPPRRPGGRRVPPNSLRSRGDKTSDTQPLNARASTTVVLTRNHTVSSPRSASDVGGSPGASRGRGLPCARTPPTGSTRTVKLIHELASARSAWRPTAPLAGPGAGVSPQTRFARGGTKQVTRNHSTHEPQPPWCPPATTQFLPPGAPATLGEVPAPAGEGGCLAREHLRRVQHAQSS